MKNKQEKKDRPQRIKRTVSGATKPPQLLTVPEQVALLKSIRLESGPGFTEGEAEATFRWAAETRFRQEILELALEGLARVVGFKEGVPVFDAVRDVGDLPVKYQSHGSAPMKPGGPISARDGGNLDQEAGQPIRIPALPEEARGRVMDQMVQWVGEWFRSRAEEVLEDPDQYGKDLEEVRWQICGAVAEDLEHDYGEGIEELIRKAYNDAGVPDLE